MNKTNNEKLIKLHGEVSSRLQKLDFSSLFKGFKKYKFAIYDDEVVCFGNNIISYEECFIGNTAIEYNDEYVAIWNVGFGYDDLDVFTSKIVHEMFHCYQMEQKDSRYANDLKLLMYPNDLHNFQQKYNENIVLVNAIKTKDQKDKIELFRKFQYIRNQRSKIYKKEILNEFLAETFEGMAQFVELASLECLNKTRYLEQVESFMNDLWDINLLFSIRRVSYSVGSLYLLLLKQINMLDYVVDLCKEETVYQLTNQHEEDIFQYDGIIEDKLKISFEEINGSKKHKIYEILKNGERNGQND